jgi:hypothetical protein
MLRKIVWDYEKIRHHAISNFSEEVFFSKVDQVIKEFWISPQYEVGLSRSIIGVQEDSSD